MSFELPKLSYSYNALEPFVDALTMEIHHSKHHAAYTNNLNAAINGLSIEKAQIEDILRDISKFPAAIRNNGGGYYNHNLFWDIISPNGGGEPSGELASEIVKQFGSFNQFKELFTQTAIQRFGSGWGWLVVKDGKLQVFSTPNQDNPLMDIAEVKGHPLLAIDVWEHAYYLKYQNRRPEYIQNFWNIVNWNAVEKRFLSR